MWKAHSVRVLSWHTVTFSNTLAHHTTRHALCIMNYALCIMH